MRQAKVMVFSKISCFSGGCMTDNFITLRVRAQCSLTTSAEYSSGNSMKEKVEI